MGDMRTDRRVYTRTSTWVDGRIATGPARPETQAAQAALLAFQDSLEAHHLFADIVRQGVERVLAPEDLARLEELQHAFDMAVVVDRQRIVEAARARRLAEIAERVREEAEGWVRWPRPEYQAACVCAGSS